MTACVVNNPEDCHGPCKCGERKACASCGRATECGRVVCLLRRRLTACPGDRVPPPYDEDAPPSLDT